LTTGVGITSASVPAAITAKTAACMSFFIVDLLLRTVALNQTTAGGYSGLRIRQKENIGFFGREGRGVIRAPARAAS
jgi:hypothetical protein